MQEINFDLLKQRRKEMRLSLQEMAECMGLKDGSTYWKYEKGVYKFKGHQLPVVASKLKLKLNDIFRAA